MPIKACKIDIKASLSDPDDRVDGAGYFYARSPEYIPVELGSRPALLIWIPGVSVSMAVSVRSSGSSATRRKSQIN